MQSRRYIPCGVVTLTTLTESRSGVEIDTRTSGAGTMRPQKMSKSGGCTSTRAKAGLALSQVHSDDRRCIAMIDYYVSMSNLEIDDQVYCFARRSMVRITDLSRGWPMGRTIDPPGTGLAYVVNGDFLLSLAVECDADVADRYRIDVRSIGHIRRALDRARRKSAATRRSANQSAAMRSRPDSTTAARAKHLANTAWRRKVVTGAQRGGTRPTHDSKSTSSCH